MRTFIFLSATLAVLVCAGAVQPISDFNQGELTFFGGAPDGMNPSSPSYGTKDGSCGYGLIPQNSFPYFSTAALNPSNPFAKAGPSNACGQCFQLQCANPTGCKTDSAGKPLSVLVMITDSCPECEADHIDTQALAFAKIADPNLGRIKIQYRRVECDVPEDMKVSVMNFDGAGGWIRLSVDDTGGRGAVKAVYVKGSNTNNWALLTNTFGAAWETSSSPAPPLDFKFECDDGEEVTAQDVVKQNGGISGGIDSPVKFSTGAQFTINDPAAQQVKSMEGGSDPMLVTSSTPGNGGGSNPAPPSNAGSSPSPSSSSSPSTSPSQSSPSPEGDCTDVAPPGSYSCAQQKQFGKCNESFMTAGNFCASTCGRCSSGSSQQVKSFSGPTPSGGRKMMSKAFLQ